MNIDNHIKHWSNLNESNDEEISCMHEEIDDGSVVGMFSVDDDMIDEMGAAGKLTNPHQYYVYVRSNEGMLPHFHVFNAEGRSKKRGSKKGMHTCVEIRRNWYWKHDNYIDDLDQKTREELDRFLSQVRTEDKYSSGVGKTNFAHTIDQWNDNNVQDKNCPNWVNSQTTEKPNYTTLVDNLKSN